MTAPSHEHLLADLKREIAVNGPMPVSAWMSRCLYDPVHGYYRRRTAIGAAGDFITAPEISQIFGELLGLWVAATWQQMGTPERLQLIELGPGRGTMMQDVLRVLRIVPDLRARLSVVLVDVSEALRNSQQATLAADANDVSLTWCDDIAEALAVAPNVPAIILANEFFDALPVTQFVWIEGRWRGRAVGLNATGELTFVALPDAPPQMPAIADASDGDIFESRRGPFGTFAATIANSSAPVTLLAIDYGHDVSSVGDTLQAMRKQTYASVLETPGDADLTAHVDFADLASALTCNGLTCDGPMTQADFLGALGFSTRLGRLLAGKGAREANAVETAAHRLVAEPGMGNHFRVLAARSPSLPVSIPFVA